MFADSRGADPEDLADLSVGFSSGEPEQNFLFSSNFVQIGVEMLARLRPTHKKLAIR
jgi:hypothetical protein